MDAARMLAGGAVLLTFLTFAPGAAATDLLNIGKITPIGSQDIQVQANVTVTGNISMSQNFITGLAQPGGGPSGMALSVGTGNSLYVAQAGDIMSGSLDMGGNDLLNVDAISDPGGTNALDLGSSGNVVIPSGELDMSGNMIDNVAAIDIQNALTDSNISNGISITAAAGGSVDKGTLANTGTLSFDWADGEVSNTLTVTGGTVDDTVLTNAGTLGFDWQDGEVVNALTINHASSGSLTLEQGTSPAATGEGRIQWDTDNDRIVIGTGGSTATFYSGAHTTDTSASTECGSDQVLEGGGGCVTNYEAGDDGDSSSSNEIQGLSSVVGQDNALNGGERIDASAGAFQLPVGTDAW